MKNCPNCKAEYDDKAEKCPECEAGEANFKPVKKDGWIVAATVANDIEFGMMASLLKMGDIPAVRDVKGVDGFLQVILGMPLGGIDVLVPEDKYEEALQLLGYEELEENFEEVEGEFEQEEEDSNS